MYRAPHLSRSECPSFPINWRAQGQWRLVDVEVEKTGSAFTYRLNRKKLKQVRRREGRYLLRTNLTETDPVKLWNYYLQLVQAEEAFRTLKSDVAIRPDFHQEPSRIEAHVFVAFHCVRGVALSELKSHARLRWPIYPIELLQRLLS